MSLPPAATSRSATQGAGTAFGRRRWIGVAAALGGAAWLPGPLHAQGDQPVRVVVANPPGGPLDIVARAITDQLAAIWKRPVVVDNRPGGNGIIAADLVAKSRPDGNTLLVTATFSESIMPYAANKLPYDAEHDLIPVTEIARVPFILVVAANGPIRNLQDFLALAQSGKGPVSVGGLGRGSSLHMAWELIRKGAAIRDVEYIAYQGPGQVQSDLVSGRLALAVDTYGSARAFIESGRLRAITVTSLVRDTRLPAVPTLDEAGLKGFEIFPWIGLVAPRGTPPERVLAIQQAVAEAIGQGPARARLAQFGFTPVGNTPTAMAATIQAERQRFRPLVKELGITLD